MNWELTDIHSHIIPDVDDGAADMQASMKLIERAYGEGIRHMIATPHFGVINAQYDSERVATNFKALADEVSKVHPDMKLYLGNELFLVPGYPDGLEDGFSNTLAGSMFVLVEFSYDVSYEFMNQQFRRLLVAGYTPILAHAERFEGVYRNLKTLGELVDMGVLVQVNSYSVIDRAEDAGLFSRLFGAAADVNRRTKLVQSMLKEGLVHFVATDCHDMPGRMPMMQKAVDKVIELVGEERAYEIFVDNPKWIINEHNEHV